MLCLKDVREWAAKHMGSITYFGLIASGEKAIVCLETGEKLILPADARIYLDANGTHVEMRRNSHTETWHVDSDREPA